MYTTWLGCSSRAVFFPVLSLVAFWQKKSRDQPETAPDRGTDQQSRRSTAGLEQHYTAGHVCLRGNLPNICCLLKQMLNRPQASKQVDIVKVQLTRTPSGQITAIHSPPMKRFQKNCCGLRCWPLGVWVEWGSGFRASRSPLFRKSSFVVG